MIQAKIICDSISPEGTRLTTFEVEFHRFVLAELNTHRVFSRNYQSSRAVPIESMIKQVSEDPAMPIYWGKNQRGMQAAEELTGDELLATQNLWKEAAKEAANFASAMNACGGHKQIVNRVLEPFIWTKGVITATDEAMKGFFALRCHPMAQPEIRALADMMCSRYEGNIPTKLEYGEWHLPYMDMDYPDTGQTSPNNESVLDCLKISTSCTAQVSYRKLDHSLEKAERIYDMLNLPSNGDWPDDPPHFSPAEHCALCYDMDQGADNSSPSDIGGNFQTTEWFQYRKILEQGREKDFT